MYKLYEYTALFFRENEFKKCVYYSKVHIKIGLSGKIHTKILMNVCEGIITNIWKNGELSLRLKKMESLGELKLTDLSIILDLYFFFIKNLAVPPTVKS